MINPLREFERPETWLLKERVRALETPPTWLVIEEFRALEALAMEFEKEVALKERAVASALEAPVTAFESPPAIVARAAISPLVPIPRLFEATAIWLLSEARNVVLEAILAEKIALVVSPIAKVELVANPVRKLAFVRTVGSKTPAGP